MNRIHRLLWLPVICLFYIPTLAFATVQIGDITIKDDGKIVFSDNTEQSTATVKGADGAQGPQGPQGNEGPPGQVNKDALCQMYSTEGVTLPPFCSKKIMFLSSQRFDGNLGGLAGADGICQDAAADGGLSGTYKAWLSDSTISAKDRLNHNPAPYVRTDGATVANNWFDLTDGYIKEPILCDEYKECNTYKDLLGNDDLLKTWTGTQQNGTKQTVTCTDWTDASGLSFPIGIPSVIDKSWTEVVSSVSSCSQFLRIYCIEQ